MIRPRDGGEPGRDRRLHRRTQARVRVTAQLVSSPDGYHLSGGDFKRGEALALAATRKTPDDVDAQFDLLVASYGVGRIARMGRAGVAPRVLDFHRGRLAAYDGRDDEAVALLGRALSAALKRLDAILAAQRTQVVQMLCSPQRLSATWQPAPETCAGVTASP
jgi:hypothetical protein